MRRCSAVEAEDQKPLTLGTCYVPASEIAPFCGKPLEETYCQPNTTYAQAVEGIRMIQDAATFVVNTGASDGDFAEPVSKTRSLMEFENRFRTLCAASLAGVYIVQDGRIKYANAAFAQMLASEPDELNGAALSWRLSTRTIVPASRSRVGRRLSGEETTSRYEARCVRKDGKIVHVEVLGSRVDYGGTPALIGTILDVSDQKRAVSALEDRLHLRNYLSTFGWVSSTCRPSSAMKRLAAV